MKGLKALCVTQGDMEARIEVENVSLHVSAKQDKPVAIAVISLPDVLDRRDAKQRDKTHNPRLLDQAVKAFADRFDLMAEQHPEQPPRPSFVETALHEHHEHARGQGQNSPKNDQPHVFREQIIYAGHTRPQKLMARMIAVQ